MNMRPICFLVRHSFDLAQTILMTEGLGSEIGCRIIILPHQYNNEIDLSEINIRSEVVDLRSSDQTLLLNWQLSGKVLAMLQADEIIVSFNKNDIVTRYVNKWFDVICFSQWRENTHSGLSFDFLRSVKQNIVEVMHRLPLSQLYIDKENPNIRSIFQRDAVREVYFCNQRTGLANNETIPYPSLPKRTGTMENATILIYGGRYLNWNYVDPEEVRHAYNKYIDYFLCKYPGTSITYLAHPLETDEFEHLNRSEVTLYRGKLNAELLTIQMHPRVSHTLSIGSTASISSYHFGIKTSVMFRDLIQNTDVLNVYSQMFEGLEPGIFECTGAYSSTERQERAELLKYIYGSSK